MVKYWVGSEKLRAQNGEADESGDEGAADERSPAKPPELTAALVAAAEAESHGDESDDKRRALPGQKKFDPLPGAAGGVGTGGHGVGQEQRPHDQNGPTDDQQIGQESHKLNPRFTMADPSFKLPDKEPRGPRFCGTNLGVVEPESAVAVSQQFQVGFAPPRFSHNLATGRS